MVSALLLLAFGLLPIGDALVRPLENEYPRPVLPHHVDGILVLGGGLNTEVLISRGAPGVGQSVMRLVSADELARRYPEARVVFSGGWGRHPDADAAAYVFAQMGLDPRLAGHEPRSRDTLENFLFSRRAGAAKTRRGLGAGHLRDPDAACDGGGRRLGWTMIPWPTDYLTPPAGDF